MSQLELFVTVSVVEWLVILVPPCGGCQLFGKFGVSVVEWLVILVPQEQKARAPKDQKVSVVEWLVILVPRITAGNAINKPRFSC